MPMPAQPRHFPSFPLAITFPHQKPGRASAASCRILSINTCSRSSVRVSRWSHCSPSGRRGIWICELPTCAAGPKARCSGALAPPTGLRSDITMASAVWITDSAPPAAARARISATFSSASTSSGGGPNRSRNSSRISGNSRRSASFASRWYTASRAGKCRM